MNSSERRRLSTILLVSLVVNQVLFLPAFAFAAPPPESVVVTVGKPNVWSLEQAHYLLARIRERNFGLRNKSLDENDLDPNAINATRLDALRTLFEAGVSFDQGLGLKNKLNRENLQFGQSRRQELMTRRSALYDEKGRLLAENGRLKSEMKSLEDNKANADAIAQKQREIEASQERLNSVDSQITNVNAEITLVGAGSSELTSPGAQAGPGAISGGLGDRIGKAITDDFTADAAKNPRLAATVKLDNYIQLQYELLAKQLTLLRDEVGPRERLLFLELPTSIYASPGTGKEMTARSSWKINGYYRENRFAVRLANLTSQKATLTAALAAKFAGPPMTAAKMLRLQGDYDTEIREINENIAAVEQDFYGDKADALKQGIDQPFTNPYDNAAASTLANTPTSRVIDLIPRQSSLNVGDIKEVVQDRGFKALFSLLMGIGGSVNYQQRRERFEQFQQQEVYASGFGKGEDTFGWIFSPMPGTKRLAPGIRTTYAVMVVPRDATKVELKAVGDSFRTTAEISAAPATLAAAPPITIDIPNGPNEGEGFFVNDIQYPKVKVNEPSVVVLRGNFSSQTGILINGTPLTRTVGLASPWLGSERAPTPISLGQPDTSVKGNYEVINANQIIMSFLMPVDFKGTPRITVITPSRARTLNDIKMSINGKSYASLDEEFRIGDKPDDPKTPLSISDVQISAEMLAPRLAPPLTSISANVNLTLSGLKDTPYMIYFNANECKTAPAAGGCKLTVLAKRFFHVEFQLPVSLEKISFTVIQDKDVTTKVIDNPLFARMTVSSVNYDPGDEEDPDDDQVTIAIEGKRIQDFVATAGGSSIEWRSRSFNQGVIVVSGLTKTTMIRIKDTLTGEEFAPISITRRPPKPKKPKEEK